jgi:hypothetical protein
VENNPALVPHGYPIGKLFMERNCSDRLSRAQPHGFLSDHTNVIMVGGTGNDKTHLAIARDDHNSADCRQGFFASRHYIIYFLL